MSSLFVWNQLICTSILGLPAPSEMVMVVVVVSLVTQLRCKYLKCLIEPVHSPVEQRRQEYI